MGKIASLGKILSFIVFSGCVSDVSEIALYPHSIRLLTEETYQFQDSEEVSFISHNPFVCTIDSKGMVTACHVGNTLVEDSRKVQVNIEVIPVYDNLKEPLLDFSMNRERIIQKLGRPIASIRDAITYKSTSEYGEHIVYAFDKDDMLMFSTLIVSKKMKTLQAFLSERYNLVYQDSENDECYYINGLSANLSTLSISKTSYSDDSWILLYCPLF